MSAESESGTRNRVGQVDVSVVVPVGRVDRELQRQLEALAGQSQPGPWELILSLNTPDPSARSELGALADRYRAGGDLRTDDTGFVPIVVDSSDLRSASHARNVGAAAATGRLLACCDGDDIADLSCSTLRAAPWFTGSAKKSSQVDGKLGPALLPGVQVAHLAVDVGQRVAVDHGQLEPAIQ